MIDDDPVEGALLEGLFGNRGFRVLLAEDGKTGAVAAWEHRPDLILLDVGMPEMDGFHVCGELKGNPLTANIPIIFLTAHKEEADVVKGFGLGAVDYVVKPFRGEEVMARVQAHLSTAHRLNSYSKLFDEEVSKKAFGQLPNESPSNSREDRMLKQAIEILLENLSTPPSLVELAHRVGTNERKLSEAFKRVHGMTAFQFLREQRLRQSCVLLRETDQPISLIAEQIGYKNSGDFTTLFRTRFGMTPREYRRAEEKQR